MTRLRSSLRRSTDLQTSARVVRCGSARHPLECPEGFLRYAESRLWRCCPRHRGRSEERLGPSWVAGTLRWVQHSTIPGRPKARLLFTPMRATCPRARYGNVGEPTDRLPLPIDHWT